MARRAGKAESDQAGEALPGASLVAQAAALDAAARGDAPVQAPAMGESEPAPFWRTTPLEAMDKAQWESLCDGCGRCCLVKLEDEDTGQIHATDIGCRLFDADSCRCHDYDNRTQVVPDCVGLTPEAVRSLAWLPPTCGYRLVNEGKDLPWWHPLVSGTPDTVVEAGVSVRGKVHCSEDEIALEDVVDRIVRWPLAWPRAARGKGPGQASGKGAGKGSGHSAGKPASESKPNTKPKPEPKPQPR